MEFIVCPNFNISGPLAVVVFQIAEYVILRKLKQDCYQRCSEEMLRHSCCGCQESHFCCWEDFRLVFLGYLSSLVSHLAFC